MSILLKLKLLLAALVMLLHHATLGGAVQARPATQIMIVTSTDEAVILTYQCFDRFQTATTTVAIPEATAVYDTFSQPNAPEPVNPAGTWVGAYCGYQ